MIEVTNDYRKNVYAPIRQFNSKMIFTLDGTSTIFYDDKIMSFSITEEMNVINNTIPSNEISITMNNEAGDFNMLNYQNMFEIIASRPKIEVFCGLITDDIGTIEYIPMGVFYLIEWASENNNKVITLTGRDNFDLLNDVSYDNTQQNNLYNLAVDILTKAGITNFIIDDSLKSINGSFNDRLDSRTALQMIGIASRSAVYQNRFGQIIIEPFEFLDESSNYLTYTGQPQVIAGTYWAMPIVSTGAGMKYIDYDQMYDIPQISLEKSIAEIVIRIYSGQGNPQEKTYINNFINGKGGASFLLDNPLIESVAVADQVAEWLIRETNYSAVYKANWRQNPILESGDVVLIEDQFGAGKQTRIYRQQFTYEGYLYGYTESRGGI